MTTEELNKLDKILEQEEKNLTDQLNRVADKNPLIKGDFVARVPNYGDEDDENTQEAIELDKNFAMEKELEPRLNAIRKARQKIKEGTYGTCDNCGSKITSEKLKAASDAAKCTDCDVKTSS